MPQLEAFKPKRQLRDALKRKPDLMGMTAKIVVDKFGSELEKRSYDSAAQIAKRVNDVIGEMWCECQKMIKEEVARQMPEPQILERPPQIIREVIKEVKQEVQDAVRNEEEKEEGPIVFNRNQEGFVVSITKGGKTLKVKRDKNGFIKSIE